MRCSRYSCETRIETKPDIVLYFIGWGNSRCIYQTWQDIDEKYVHVGPRIDVRSRELVRIALRDATNAMAVARTSENAAKIRKFVVMFLPRLVNATTVRPPYEFYDII